MRSLRAVIGRIRRTPYSWEPEYHGDPTSIMIARRIVDLVRDRFDLASATASATTPTQATIADNEASLIEHDRWRGLAWEHFGWQT